MKLCLNIALLLFLSLSVNAANDKKPDISKAVAIAQKLVFATKEGDYDYVISNTHPKIVEMLGGHKEAIKVSRALFVENKIEILDYTIGKVTEISSQQDKVFVVIPTTLKMKFPHAIITSQSYLLSISEDKGKSWVFIDGNGINDNPELRKKLFPNFPSDLSLPKIPAPEVQKL